LIGSFLMIAARLVPGLLQRFNPSGVLEVNFGGQFIEIGQSLSATEAASAPSLAIRAVNNASDISTEDRYTVMMIDADIVGTNAMNTPLTRHWLVNGATLSDEDPHTITFDSATTITDYAGPGPAEGSGPHRYTLLVYLQPENFTAPANLSTAGTPLSTMLLGPYVTDTGLGALVAANYIQVENGQATVSIPATTAVNPSTVVAPSVSGTVSMSAASMSGASMSGASASMASSASRVSGSMSASAVRTSGAAASATPSSGANSQRQLGWTVGVGALGVAGAVIGAGLGF